MNKYILRTHNSTRMARTAPNWASCALFFKVAQLGEFHATASEQLHCHRSETDESQLAANLSGAELTDAISV